MAVKIQSLPMVGVTGIEPAKSRSQSERLTIGPHPDANMRQSARIASLAPHEKYSKKKRLCQVIGGAFTETFLRKIKNRMTKARALLVQEAFVLLTFAAQKGKRCSKTLRPIVNSLSKEGKKA